MSMKNIMRKKRKCGVRKMLSLGLSCFLVTGLLCGCGERNVDYSVDTEQPAEAATGSLAQFAEAERWIDKWEIPTEDGGEFSMSVNAKVTTPDTDAMYVVEVEETALDAEWKQQFLKLFYGGDTFYYHDMAHYPKEELDTLIGYCEDTIAAVESPDYQEDYDGEKQILLDINKEDLEEYRSYLQNAPDDYVQAEEFDDCDDYLGEVGGILCTVQFPTRGEEGAEHVVSVSAYPLDREAFGPESDFDYASMFQIAHSSENSENTCNISPEEARALADDFLGRMGRSNQVYYDESDTVWARLVQDEIGRAADLEEVTYGYSFTYGTGVGDVAFAQFGDVTKFDIFYDEIDWDNVYDFADKTVITVTDEGVVGVEMNYPVTVKTVSQPVEMLSLDTIQSILKDEVVNHGGGNDDFQAKPYFFALDLIYFRVKDDAKKGSYSYVPTWRLSARSDGFYYHPVLVNAIDGSVIHIQEQL